MPISLFPYPLQFTARDFALRPLDELASEMRVSRAFLRLCLDAGCPQQAGTLSTAALLVWLFERYPDVRALAGLRELAPIPALPAAIVIRLRMANAVLTLLEYGRSRASRWQQKQLLRQAAETVDRIADRTA